MGTIFEQMRAGIATYGNESEEMASVRRVIRDMHGELQESKAYIQMLEERINSMRLDAARLRKEIEQGNDRSAVLNRTLIGLWKLYTDAVTATMKSVDDGSVASVVKTVVAKG